MNNNFFEVLKLIVNETKEDKELGSIIRRFVSRMNPIIKNDKNKCLKCVGFKHVKEDIIKSSN